MQHILSRDNPKIKEAARLQRDSALRRELGLLVCEGATLLGEALLGGLMPHSLFVLEERADTLPLGLTCPVFTVTAPVMDKLRDTVTGSALVFTLPIPPAAPPTQGPVLALDGIADPGNLGTILRTADALGASVALLPGCADPTAPKVVRAAMGALFRAFPYACDYTGLEALCREGNLPIYAAAAHGDATDIRNLDVSGACLLIGNEAHGVSARGLSLCEKKVAIPMAGAESLNAAVAAAILLWEAVR